MYWLAANSFGKYWGEYGKYSLRNAVDFSKNPDKKLPYRSLAMHDKISKFQIPNKISGFFRFDPSLYPEEAVMFEAGTA